MICNLCKCPTQFRTNTAIYAVHKNAEGVRCEATGIHPDIALAMRRSFRGTNGTRVTLSDNWDNTGIAINAIVERDEVVARVWAVLTPADAVRMAAELIEMAQLHADGRP